MREKACLIVMHEPSCILFAAPWCDVIEVERAALFKLLRVAQWVSVALILLVVVALAALLIRGGVL